MALMAQFEFGLSKMCANKIRDTAFKIVKPLVVEKIRKKFLCTYSSRR